MEIKGPDDLFPMLDGPAIPWPLAEKLYDLYSQAYGHDQSLERIAERGGFGWSEVPQFQEVINRRSQRSRSVWQTTRDDDLKRERHVPHSFWHLCQEVASWGDRMFPDSTTVSVGLHLKKEIKELLEADNPDDEALELADVLMLIIHYAHKRRIDILLNCWNKFEIVKRREWVLQSDGTHEHKRS